MEFEVVVLGEEMVVADDSRSDCNQPGGWIWGSNGKTSCSC